MFRNSDSTDTEAGDGGSDGGGNKGVVATETTTEAAMKYEGGDGDGAEREWQQTVTRQYDENSDGVWGNCLKELKSARNVNSNKL